MRRREFLAASGGVLAALAGCFGGPGRSLPESPGGEWRQHARDSRNTGAADVAVPPRATPAWDAGEVHTAAPLVDDGTVYSVESEATALDAQSGDQRWEEGLPEGTDHTPALTADRLVVGSGDRLLGLSREDGSEEWSESLPGPVTGPVTVAEGESIAIVPVGEAGLVAHDHRTGDPQWEAPVVGARTPAVADGTVHVAGYLSDGDTGVLRGLSAADGSELWETELDHPDTPPVLADEGLVVADAGTIALHDPADGTRLRTLAEFGEDLWEPPAVADGTAYVATTESPGELVAVSLADGTVEWRVDATVTVDTGVVVGREAVVTAVTDLPGLAAFERSDGTRRWEHTIEGFDAAASTPPTLADGAVFYASNESLGVVALGDLPPQDEE